MKIKEKFYFWKNRNQEYEGEEDIERENDRALGCILLSIVVTYTIGLSALFYDYMGNTIATRTEALIKGNLERNISRVAEPNVTQLDTAKFIEEK